MILPVFYSYLFHLLAPIVCPSFLLLDAASSLQPNGTNFFLYVRWDFFLPFRSYAAYALVLRIWLSMRSLREQMISSSLCWSRCFSVAISDYKSELCFLYAFFQNAFLFVNYLDAASFFEPF